MILAVATWPETTLHTFSRRPLLPVAWSPHSFVLSLPFPNLHIKAITYPLHASHSLARCSLPNLLILVTWLNIFDSDLKIFILLLHILLEKKNENKKGEHSFLIFPVPFPPYMYVFYILNFLPVNSNKNSMSVAKAGLCTFAPEPSPLAYSKMLHKRANLYLQHKCLC